MLTQVADSVAPSGSAAAAGGAAPAAPAAGAAVAGGEAPSEKAAQSEAVLRQRQEHKLLMGQARRYAAGVRQQRGPFPPSRRSACIPNRCTWSTVFTSPHSLCI